MPRFFSIASIAILAGLLSGCAATTTISATQANAVIDVKTSTQVAHPRTESFSTTSFGNYEFRARAEGHEPFFGILPMKFNGGYLALDILFFAPATMFNLREVYPLYEFDVEKKVVKFRKKESDEWNTFVPLEVEAARAREFFKNM